MQLLLVARAHGYEANPWSGFDFKTVIADLGLDPLRFVPVMCVAIGKPDASVTPLQTQRYPAEQLTEFI
jgi:nitroreductase